MYLKKKRRNNRCLEKFCDAKYIDSRDGSRKSGRDLFNGRINRSHKQDSENLHKYRKQKLSKGRRITRRKRYTIQPHDVVMYAGDRHEVSGCYCNGTRVILLPSKKSVSVKKISVCKYAGGYVCVQHQQ